MTGRRLLGTACAATVLAVLALAFGAGPAQATSYRFWTYWHGTGSGGWTFSPVGASYRPADGAVEGWRFAVSAATGSRTPPRTSVSFATVCGSTEAGDGTKRVALVVDFGTSADAPPGQHPPRGVDTYCAVVGTSADGYDVLQSYASVRAEGGLVCSVAGYPAGECGAAVRPSASPTPTRRTTPPAPPSSSSSASSARASRPPAAATESRAAPSGSAPASSPGSVAPGTTTIGPATTTAGAPTPVAVAAGGLPTEPTGGGSGAWIPAALGGVAVAGLGLAGWRRGRRVGR